MTNLKYDEILALLQTPSKKEDGTFAVRDLVVQFGITKNRANHTVRRLFDAGVLEFAGERMEPRLDGKVHPIPTYRLTKPLNETPKGNRTKARKAQG